MLDEMIFEYKIASQISHREKYWMFWLHLYTFPSSGPIYPRTYASDPGSGAVWAWLPMARVLAVLSRRTNREVFGIL